VALELRDPVPAECPLDGNVKGLNTVGDREVDSAGQSELVFS
jgi:hypothetical protein